MKKLKYLVQTIICTVFFFLIPLAQAATDFPSKAVTIIVPFTPGAGTDISARMLAETLTELTGQPFIVENKPGGNNTIGVRHVINAKPDGHTLLIGTNSPVAGNVALFESLAYDPVEDLTPIVPVSRQEWVLLINPKGPFESFEDLLKTGKEDPEALSAGAGAAGYQLATLMLAKHAGIEVNVIPYNGTPGAVQDLIGNRLSFIIVDAGSVLSYIESETLIPLVALAEERMSVLPDVPTLKELGMPSIPFMSWAGIFAPKNIPDDIIRSLESLFHNALQTEKINKYYADIGAEVFIGDGEQLREIQLSDIDNYKHAMEETGLPKIQ